MLSVCMWYQKKKSWFKYKEQNLCLTEYYEQY